MKYPLNYEKQGNMTTYCSISAMPYTTRPGSQYKDTTQSLSPVRPTLHDQAANTDFGHDAPAMQHPVHVRRAVRTSLALQQQALVRLAVRASNYNDPTG